MGLFDNLTSYFTNEVVQDVPQTGCLDAMENDQIQKILEAAKYCEEALRAKSGDNKASLMPSYERSQWIVKSQEANTHESEVNHIANTRSNKNGNV